MSFRLSYQSFKSGAKTQSRGGLFRDPTEEQWKKTMDAYYIREQSKKNTAQRRKETE